MLQADVMQMSYNNPCLAASILNRPGQRDNQPLPGCSILATVASSKQA